MENKQLIDLARDQLNRVLGFFSRVDAKISVLLMSPLVKELQWNSRPALIAFVARALIALSLFLLYQASFPRLAGGRRSLLYFREIAKRKETAFIAEFNEQSEEAYLKDLLAQLWRNSEILKQKYDYIKSFIVWTKISIAGLCSLLRSISWRNAEERRNKPFGKVDGVICATAFCLRKSKTEVITN